MEFFEVKDVYERSTFIDKTVKILVMQDITTEHETMTRLTMSDGSTKLNVVIEQASESIKSQIQAQTIEPLAKV